MADKKREDIDEQLIEREFKKATLHQFFSTPVWVAIEELLIAQEAVVLAHLTDSEGSRDDDMYFKGINSQIQYMKNIQLILLKGD